MRVEHGGGGGAGRAHRGEGGGLDVRANGPRGGSGLRGLGDLCPPPPAPKKNRLAGKRFPPGEPEERLRSIFCFLFANGSFCPENYTKNKEQFRLFTMK